MTDNEMMLLAMRAYRSGMAEQVRMKEYIIKHRHYFGKTDAEIAALKDEVKALDAQVDQCDAIIMRNENRRRRTWA